MTDAMPFAADPEPWPKPVPLAAILDEIASVIRRYVAIDSHQADAAALWSVHTYLTEQFSVSPLALINAPERACGKTLMLTLLGEVVFRPLMAAIASPSSLFRSIEKWGPTLLLDEGDTFFKDKSELAGMVNAGYAKGGFVLRTETIGDQYEPRTFPVYSAKAIAGITLERHLQDATLSRGIVFNMRRKLAHEKVERFRHIDPALFPTLRSKAFRAALDEGARIGSTRPALPEDFGDRTQDNWEPLLAIAECAGPEWAKRGMDAAIAMTPAKSVHGGAGNELLADIRDAFGAREKITTIELIAELISDTERAWATYNRGRPLTPRQLSQMLGAYGISPKTVRTSPHTTTKGYTRAQFEDAFKRFLDPAEEVEVDDSGLY